MQRKKVTAAFDGGRLTSDGGVLLLSGADRQVGLCATLAAVIPITEMHVASRIIWKTSCVLASLRSLAAIPTQTTLMICAATRRSSWPAASAESGDDPPRSRPSRGGRTRDLRTLLRLGYAMIDLWCRSYRRPPKSITLDVDDTVDVVHGHQQLSLFNAHYDERCFLTFHVTTRTAATAWRCCCGLARRRPAGRSVVTSAG